MTGQKCTIERHGFAVLDRAVCVADPQLSTLNRQFLGGLDPEFFVYQARVHQAAMCGDAESRSDSDKAPKTDSYAALALRINYGMALESLFAMLCAIVQAPRCVFGWLNAYRNDELVEMVRRIDVGDPVKGRPPLASPTWESIARLLLFPMSQRDPVRYEHLCGKFAQVWRRFANDFCDPLRSKEYNSLKHSFRVLPGAFKMSFGEADDPFFSAESPLGHRFPYLKKNDGRKFDYSVSFATMALEPDAYCAALGLVSCSLHNAISYARFIAQDDPRKAHVRFPQDDTFFDTFEQHFAPIQSFTLGGSATPDIYWTAEEILSGYE